MRKTVALKIMLLCTICLLLYGGTFAFADSPVGRWSGSFGGEGRSDSASATFRSNGSCKLSALGISASGSWGGGSIHVSAYGYSMTLSYSCKGDHITIHGWKGKYSGSMSLARVGGGGGGGGSEAKAEITSPVFGKWTAETNGIRYEVSLYKDGFLYWMETSAVEETAEEATAKTYGTRLMVTGEQLTLTALEDSTGEDVPAMWSGAVQEDGKTWALAYRIEDGSLTLSVADGDLITLVRIADADSAPAEALFQPYITLEKGDRGVAVQMLQEALIAAGYLDGKADGMYGTETKKAVQAFQMANEIEADGIAGKDTLSVIYY